MTTNRTGLEHTLSDADLIAIASAAEEVISAIAGENEDAHPDNSTKMCALWDDLNDRHAPPAVVKAVVLELLARREASKEPLMYTVTFDGQIEEIGGDCQSFKREDCQQYIEWLCDEDNQDGYAVTPLFSAPPLQAVTVPDGVEIDDIIKVVDVKYSLSNTGVTGYRDGWNACRAAMLKNVTNEP